MGALLIAGLSFGYDDALLFEDLDLSFPEGGLTGIVGKNGTGKSTLCDIVAGIHAAEVQFCEWRGQQGLGKVVVSGVWLGVMGAWSLWILG